MKISTFPVFYIAKNYSGCSIQEALLYMFRNAHKFTLTLPDINKARVNGNALVGSYGHAIMELNRKGYRIRNELKPVMKGNKVIRQDSIYILENPTYNPE